MLNPTQQEAVEYIQGASLIIAGAGSGKTRVLTHKIAYLIQQGLPPSTILALTFTNKAAGEMKERMSQLLGDVRLARRVVMGTFHSVFSRILRQEAESLGYTRDFTIYDAQDSKNIIKQIIKEMSLDDKVYKASSVASRISSAKNSLVTPGIYQSKAEWIQEDMHSKRPLIRDIYKRYAARCKQANAMDFDDLLLNTNILFRDFPQTLQRYQQLFRYILVDEYQDTNYAQHLIVKLLAKEHGLVCAVGDDAQSIYSFRGAVIDNIIHFKNDFPDCRLFKLEQNYRSTQTIVEAANSVIKHNKKQIQKNVFSENEQGERLELIQTQSDMEEAAAVANKIVQANLSAHSHYKDFAILYRTNSQSRVLEDALLNRNIPYRIYGGLSFYQRKEIKDIVGYLRMCINPSDEEAFKRIINTPARGLGDTTVKKIIATAQLQSKSLWEIACDPLAWNLNINSGTARKLAGFCDFIQNKIDQQNELLLEEFVSSIVKESGYWTELVQDNSVEAISRRENIEEFLRAIHDYRENYMEENDHTPLLSEFLSEISLLSDQDVKSEDEVDPNHVTLMTIHSAKGLEFKHVFIVGLEENLFPSQMALEEPRGLEEERRLMYVAITRAEKGCTLSCAKTRYRNGKLEFPRPSRFLSEINSSLLNGRLAGGLYDEPFESSFGSQSAPLHASRTERPNERFADTLEQRASNFRQTLPSRSQGGGSSATMPTQTVVHAQGTGNYQIHNSISIHTRIVHERFGLGTVVRSENDRITVQFDQIGEKTLILKFARLEVLD